MKERFCLTKKKIIVTPSLKGIKQVKVVSLPLQITLLADGLIGMDLLENFQRIIIDFEEQTIEV
jgi:hypothetical protein